MWSHYTPDYVTVVEKRNDGKFVVTSGSRHDNESTAVSVWADVRSALRAAGYPTDIAVEIGLPEIPPELR